MVRREILRRVIAPHRNTRFSSFLLGFLSKKLFQKIVYRTHRLVFSYHIESKHASKKTKRIKMNNNELPSCVKTILAAAKLKFKTTKQPFVLIETTLGIVEVYRSGAMFHVED